MNDNILTNAVERSSIRKELCEGEWYYSIIDLVAELLNIDMERARTYYHVLKNRTRKNHEEIFPIVRQIKIKALDGKMRFTDCTNGDGVESLRRYLEPYAKKKSVRVNNREDDEVINFHPIVINSLMARGWRVEHHVSLPSGKVIDLVGHFSKDLYVIECKPRLNNAKFYAAVGQVLCYCDEYSPKAIPAIATLPVISDYAKQRCESLGIELIEMNT